MLAEANTRADRQGSYYRADASAALHQLWRWLASGEGGFRVEWLGVGNSVLDRAVSRFQNDVAQRTGLDVGRAGSAQLRIEQFFYS
jgi:hypothetical protein